MSITLADNAGLFGCFLVVTLLAVIHHLAMKVMRPKENPYDYLALMFIWVSRGGIVIFSLVPCGFFAMLHLTNNPHVLDFLIFK